MLPQQRRFRSKVRSTRQQVHDVLNSILPHSHLFKQHSADCPVSGWPDCALIDCRVTLTHSAAIAGGNLNYLLLSSSDKVSAMVQQGTLDVQYSGHSTMKASILVALQGVPVGRPLDKLQQGFVEEVATAYGAEQMVGVVDASIVGTTITNQRGPGISRRIQRNLQNSSAVDGSGDGSVDGWIELTIDVLAIYVPPYTGAADFGETVLSSFRTKQNDFVDDLKTARYRPDSLVQGERGDYFAGITNVNVRSVEDATNVGTTEGDGGSTGEVMGLSLATLSAICVSLILFAAAWIWFINRRAKKAATNEGEVEFVDSTGRKRRRSSVMFMLGGRIPTPTNEETGKVGEVFAIEGMRQQTIQTAELLGSSGRQKGFRDEGASVDRTNGRTELARKGGNSSHARAGVSRSRSRDQERGTSDGRLASRSRSRDSTATSNESNGRSTSAYGASYEEIMPISRHNSRDPSIPNASSHMRAAAVNTTYPHYTTDHNVRANPSSHNRQPMSFSNSDSLHSTRATRTIGTRFGPDGSSHSRQPLPFPNSDLQHSTRATRTIGPRLDANGSAQNQIPVSFASSDTRHTTRAARTTGMDIDPRRNEGELAAGEAWRVRESSSSHNRVPVSSTIGDSRHSTRAARTPLGGDVARASEASSHARAHVSASTRLARNNCPVVDSKRGR